METLLNWLSGTLTPEERVWSALAPGLVMVVYFLGGLALYSVRTVARGPHRDRELEQRGSTIFLGSYVRHCFAWVMQPLWRTIVWSGIPATAATTLSLLLALAAGVAVSMGRFSLGGWLYIFAGILDYLDGRIARATDSASPRGAAFDSIVDRYADSAILVGLCWYYRDHWALLPGLLALVGTHLIPYVRAKGESLGIPVKVGIMQRAERIVYLGAMVAVSPIYEAWFHPGDEKPLHVVAVIGLVFLAASTQLTGVQRFVFLLQRLEPADSPSRTQPSRRLMTKNVISAVLATGIDFTVVAALVSSSLALWPPLATAVGCGVGAVVNFTLNRQWTFRSDAPHLVAASKYSFVSVTSAALNAGGVALLLALPSLTYWMAWLLVRASVFLAWNYPLQRDYVFTTVHSRSMSEEPSKT